MPNPTPLDVLVEMPLDKRMMAFYRSIIQMPASQFNGNQFLEHLDATKLKELDDRLKEAGCRCFIGNAVILYNGDYDLENLSECEYIAIRCQLPYHFVRAIYGGVVGMTFKDAKRFARAVVDRFKTNHERMRMSERDELIRKLGITRSLTPLPTSF